MPKLLISVPNAGDVVHELTADEITIGRGRENKIRIESSSISFRHARLVKQNGVYRIEDLNSTNRTFVNGAMVTQAALDSSCIIRFGSVEASFKLDTPGGMADTQRHEIGELQKQLAAIRQARDAIHLRNEQLVRERDEAVQEKEIVAAELAHLQQTTANADRDAVRAEFNKKFEEQRKQILSLIEERKAVEGRLQASTETLQKTQKEVGELERQAARLHEVETKLAEAEKAHGGVDAAASGERDARLAESEEARADLEKNAAEAQRELEKQTAARRKLDSLLTESEKANADLEKRHLAVRKVFELRLAELEKALADLKEQPSASNAELETRLIEAEKARAKLAERCAEVEGRHTEAQKQRTEAAQQVTALQGELDALKVNRDQQLAELQAHTAAAGTALEQQTAGLRAQLETERKAITDLQAEAETENRRHTARIARIESTRAEALRERDAAREDLQKKLADLTHSAHRFEAQKAELESQKLRLEQLEAERERLSRELDEQRQIASASEDKHNAVSQLGMQLNAELAAAREQIDFLTRERDSVRRQQQKLLGELDETRRAAAARSENDRAAAAATAQVRSDLEAARNQLSDAAAEVSKLKADRDKAAADLESKQGELEQARSAHEIEAGRNAELAAEIAGMRARLSAVEGERDQAKNAAEKAQAGIEAASGEKSAAETKIRELTAEWDGARATIADLEIKHSEATRRAGEIQSQADSIKAERDQLGAQLQALSAERDRLREGAAKSQAEIERLGGELGAAKREIETAKREADAALESTSAVRKENEKRISALTTELNTVRASASAFERERDEARAQLSAMTEDLDRQRATASRSQHEIEQMKAQLAAAEREIDGAKRDAEEARREAARARPSAEAAPAEALSTTKLRIASNPPRMARNVRERVSHEESASPSPEPLRLATGPEPPGGSVEIPEKIGSWLGLKRSTEKQRAPSASRKLSPETVKRDKVKLEKMPDVLNKMRRELQYLIRHPRDVKTLDGLIEDCASMTAITGSSVFGAVHHMALALESVLRDLKETPERINQATLRTITQSLDFISSMLDDSALERSLDLPEPHVLTIDDEPEIIEAVVGAMEMVGLQATGTPEPKEGLDRLGREKFDLVFLDVRLPDTTGWDICTRIRSMPEHKKTPIVFLTGLNTIENKVQSTLQGGNDFIGKPFNLRELGIKALTWVYRGQLALQ